MDGIKVSVIVICYKHAKYIRQCLDSILSQNVNFKYEIVVGDDCSNDGTKEVLLEYKEKYPDIFVLLINEENIGASKNSFNVRKHCRGEYLSSCEGDDFWIDNNKLQKQVDFLDTHPNYSAVATNTLRVDHYGNTIGIKLLKWQVAKTYTFHHFLKYGMVIHGNSMMRRNRWLEFDEKYQKLCFAEPTMGDIIIRCICYDQGPIYVLPDITHAHRDGSMDKTSFTARNKNKALDYTKMYFRIVDNLTEYFDYRYNLEELKANRLGANFLSILRENTTLDISELKKIFKMLTPKYRILSVFRFIQKTFRKIIHKIAKKLKLYYKI